MQSVLAGDVFGIRPTRVQPRSGSRVGVTFVMRWTPYTTGGIVPFGELWSEDRAFSTQCVRGHLCGVFPVSAFSGRQRAWMIRHVRAAACSSNSGWWCVDEKSGGFGNGAAPSEPTGRSPMGEPGLSPHSVSIDQYLSIVGYRWFVVRSAVHGTCVLTAKRSRISPIGWTCVNARGRRRRLWRAIQGQGPPGCWPRYRPQMSRRTGSVR